MERFQPYNQEFAFYPYKEPFYGSINELDILFLNISQVEVKVIIEFERKYKGTAGVIADKLDLNENIKSMLLKEMDIPNLETKFREIISGQNY